MKRRRLGRTNLMVPEISLGTVELGLSYGLGPDGPEPPPAEAEAARLLHQALDLGINFIDTARLYGESEARIGRALKGRRDAVIIASKVPSFEKESLRGPLLRDRVIESVHESLRMLNTDAVDIMMIHSTGTAAIAQGEIIGILEELRKAGCIRFVGASVYGEEAAMLAIESGRYDCLQIAYNVLDRRPEERTLPAAADADIGIVVRSVLLKGTLTARSAHLTGALQPLARAVDALRAVARSHGCDLPELAYRYVLANPLVHSALVGTSRIEEVQAALDYAAAGALPVEWVARIADVRVSDDSLLNPGNWPPS